MADTSDRPMSEADIRQFFMLLRRWCASELDQFDHLIVPTRWGEVYVGFSRERPPHQPEDTYRRLPADLTDDDG
jgi:hypothetical protein